MREYVSRASSRPSARAWNFRMPRFVLSFNIRPAPHRTLARTGAFVAATALFALSSAQAAAPAQPAPAIRFSGLVDADFYSALGQGKISSPRHLTGLQADLTTTLTFAPGLSADLRTTMNDGVVPAQGAGNTNAPVVFDGAVLNWAYDARTTLHLGDVQHGTGYFRYYLHKRSAVVVGETTLRGAGVTRDNWHVATGTPFGGPGDTVGPSSQWSTFARYTHAFAPNMRITPSLQYTAGVAGATPVTGGLSFEGTFGGDFGTIDVHAHVAGNYHSDATDPGFTVLLEPSWSRGPWSIATTFFLNEKGTAPNPPSQTLTGAEFDDLLVYVEPGYAFSERLAAGLPLEYHDASAATAASQGYDQSFWAVPTLYVYPGAGIEWWLWAQVVKPQSGSGSLDPLFFAGSELIFRF